MVVSLIGQVAVQFIVRGENILDGTVGFRFPEGDHVDENGQVRQTENKLLRRARERLALSSE